MSVRAAPKPELIEATETTIEVEFTPVDSINDYELQWKPFEAGWDSLASCEIKSSGKKKCKTEAYDLQPGMTYCVRLVCVQEGNQGEPSKELIVDTEQVGCAPTSRGGCCVIQ